MTGAARSIYRGFKFRLYPTTEQAATLIQWAGVCRLIYNAALRQREVWWRHYFRETGQHISMASQSREVTLLRADVEWIRAVPREAIDSALGDLDRAYASFFTGKARYPTPRRKGENEAVRFRGLWCRARKLNEKWSEVLLPKMGWVRFRDTRAIPGKWVGVTVSLVAGSWFVSVDSKIEHSTAPTLLPSVGIDRGVANTITLSTGEHYSVPASLMAIEKRQRRARRDLARKKRGSARYARQRRRVAAMSARCARIRADWRHKTTIDIARRFGVAVLEDLRIRGMTTGGHTAQKRGLNRAILNQGWGAFETVLTYKLEERGGRIAKVPAPYTSQTCSVCGTIDSKSRESQASFVCQHCGFAAHADVNAAINILRGSTPRVEARESPADEARTTPNQAALAA